MVALYDGAIRYVDDVIADFVQTLKTLGLYDQTTIIITADHGEGFGEHNRYRHSYHFYDEIIRIPLIIKSARIKEKGACSDQLVASLDFFPTILDIFGISIPAVCEGKSIFTKSKSGSEGSRMIFSEYHNFGMNNQCIRGKKWKLIYEGKVDKKEFFKHIKSRKWLPLSKIDKDVFELYNLESDPFEKKNLYEEKPEVAQVLWKQLQKFMNQESFDAKTVDESKIDPEVLKNLKSLGYFR
jgi:arylsulfatase A-like enzyme